MRGYCVQGEKKIGLPGIDIYIWKNNKRYRPHGSWIWTAVHHCEQSLAKLLSAHCFRIFFFKGNDSIFIINEINLNTLYSNMLCAQFNWNEAIGSRREVKKITFEDVAVTGEQTDSYTDRQITDDQIAHFSYHSRL